MPRRSRAREGPPQARRSVTGRRECDGRRGPGGRAGPGRPCRTRAPRRLDSRLPRGMSSRGPGRLGTPSAVRVPALLGAAATARRRQGGPGRATPGVGAGPGRPCRARAPRRLDGRLPRGMSSRGSGRPGRPPAVRAWRSSVPPRRAFPARATSGRPGRASEAPEVLARVRPTPVRGAGAAAVVGYRWRSGAGGAADDARVTGRAARAGSAGPPGRTAPGLAPCGRAGSAARPAWVRGPSAGSGRRRGRRRRPR